MDPSGLLDGDPWLLYSIGGHFRDETFENITGDLDTDFPTCSNINQDSKTGDLALPLVACSDTTSLPLSSPSEISPTATPISGIDPHLYFFDHAIAKNLGRADQAQVTAHETRPKSRKNSQAYQCEKCPKSFSNRKTFGGHMWTEHNVQAFKCRYCDTQVARYDNLRSHEKRCKGLHSTGDKRLVLDSSDVTKGLGSPKKRLRAQTSDISNKTTPQTTTSMPVIPAIANESDSSLSSGSGSDDEIQEANLLVQTLKEELKKNNADLVELRCQVSKLALECDVWKQNYLQLMLGDKVS